MDRTWTRDEYHRARQRAHRAERDAALLAGYDRTHGTRNSDRDDRENAARLRAEIAAPFDAVEACRNARWASLRHRLDLHLALKAQAFMAATRRAA